MLISYSLITEWRISKRVEEQFNAFIAGFNELIPPDLVNVFDERELELLIGGIADIDVEDWKKHTDYRGYTENDEVIVNFWKVCLAQNISYHAYQTLNHVFLFFHSAFEVGMQSKNQDCYSLPQELLVFLSMGSKIYKEVMDLDDSPLKRLENSCTFQNHTHGLFPCFVLELSFTDIISVSIVLIYHLTNHTTH